MSTDPYNSLLDEMERAAPKAPRAPKPAGNRYGAYDAQTEGDWSISRAPAVKDWYRATYGRDLPVTAEGQSSLHTRRGLNHSDSLDVGLNPTTPEGQAFASYLKQNRIPYLAYDRAVPNAATGPHFHVGYPSKRGSAQPADPYAALLDELESSPAPTPPSQGEAVGTNLTPLAGPQTPATPAAAPPQNLGYVDERQETPEDFASLQPRTPKIDPSTQAGRAQRDERLRLEKAGGGLYRVPIGEGFGEAVRVLADEISAPPEFVAEWLRAKGPLNESSPTGYVTIPTRRLGQMREDYRKSLSLPQRAVANVSEVLSTHSPGEALVGVGGETASGALRGLDVATRPLQAASGAFWAKVRGASDRDAVKTAVQEFYGENPELAKNVIAEALRDSDTLESINPRLPGMAGFIAEMVADPANLIPAGLVARGASKVGKAAQQGGRLAKVAGELRDLGVFVPDVPREAFRASGDARVLGDLTRRAVPEASMESLPDIPVGTLEAPRVVRNRAQAAPGVSEAAPVPERAATAPQASTSPVIETIIKHSDPRIDGGRVIGSTPDGRLRVENNEGGVSVVQHPRKGGNREAALVRREVENVPVPAQAPDGAAGTGVAAVDSVPQSAPGGAGITSRAEAGRVAAPEVRAVGREGVGGSPRLADTAGLESAPGRGVVDAPQIDRLNAPVPGPRAFRAQMKSKFNLSDSQADAVTEIADARARAWAKERGRDASDYYVERFAGIERGGESGAGALNQFAGEKGAAAREGAIDNLQVAREMERAGKDAKVIWRATGWERGADRKWRHEIEDAQFVSTNSKEARDAFNAKVRRLMEAEGKDYDDIGQQFDFIEQRGLLDEYDATTELLRADLARAVDRSEAGFKNWHQSFTRKHNRVPALADIIPDAPVLKAYPELSRVPVSVLPAEAMGGARGQFNGTNIYISEAVGDVRSTLHHEIQHAIQKIEGFAPGGSPEQFARSDAQAMARVNFLNNEMSRLVREMDAAAGAGNKEVRKALHAEYEAAMAEKMRLVSEKDLTTPPVEKYHRLAGEAEARNVQSRLYMTPEARRAMPPVETEDVARSSQIILNPNILRQENKAAVEFMQDGRAVLRAFQKADVSSAVHELAHVFRRDLPENLLRDAEEAIGVKAGKWTVPDEEKFARGFERYLKTGEAPNVNLRRVYESFKTWLTEIYGAVRGKNHPLNFKPNEKLVAVFDRMLGGEPKGEYGQLIHQLHKAPSEGTPAFFENAQVKRALGLKAEASTADVRAALTEAVGRPRSSHLSPEDVRGWADSKGLQGAARVALDDAVAKFEAKAGKPVDARAEAGEPADLALDAAERFLDENVKLVEDFAAGRLDAEGFRAAAVKAGVDRETVDDLIRGAEEFKAQPAPKPTEYEATGIRRSRYDPATASLSEAVRANGGFRITDDNSGEMRRLRFSPGLARRDGGVGADEMVTLLKEDGFFAWDEDVSPADLLEMVEADARGVSKRYSNLKEHDFEAMYREENPDDAADALVSLLETERGGILFDKVRDGTATPEETAEFGELAAEVGASPEHVLEVVRRGRETPKEGAVSDTARSQSAEDFNFGDDSVEDAPSWLYQSDEGGLVAAMRKAARRGARHRAEVKRLEASISDLTRRIDERDISVRGRRPSRQVSQEVASLRERRDSLRKELDALRRSMPVQGPRLTESPKEGPRLSEASAPKEGPRVTQAPFQGPRASESRPEGPRLSEGRGRKEGPRPAEAPVQGPKVSDARPEGPRLSEGRGRAEGPKLEATPVQGPKQVEAVPGRDADLRDFFRTPLSNLDFKGTYERLGGEPGKKVSDAFREAQFRTDERLNELRKTAKPDRLEEVERVVRREELDNLRSTLRPLVKQLRDGGKPELAEDVVVHLNALSGAPTKFERGVGNLIRETPGLNKIVKNPDLAMRHAAARLTSLQATLKLKYNVRSSLVNLTDPLTTLWPYASTADMAAVYADFLKPSTRKMLADKGVTGGVTKLDEAGLVKTRMGLSDRLSPFRKASEVNRSVAYLYGLKEAKRMGKTGEDAHRLALDWAKKVEFDNSVWNAPPVLRTSGGKVLGQFKGYAVKSFENLANVVRKKETDKAFTRGARVSKFVAGKTAVGGLRAGGLLTKTAGYYAAGALAYQLMQKGYSREEAQRAADAVYYGAPALIGLDLSGSVMMFEPPFGNSLSEQVVNTVGGPTVGTGIKIGQGISDAYKAEDGKKKSREEKLKTIGERTLNAVTPYYKMGKSAVQTAGGRPTQKLNDKEVPVTTYEGVMKALGFTLTKQTKFYDAKDFKKPNTGRGGALAPRPPKPPRVSQ